LEQTAKVFLVTADTIGSWTKRIDEEGANALVQVASPVNKLPDYIRYLVQQLRLLCPSLGKQKIAQILGRAGLHLGTTTVGRILKEDPNPEPTEKQAPSQPAQEAAKAEAASVAEPVLQVVTAKRINHVWHVDLTLVPTRLGFWASWLPCSLSVLALRLLGCRGDRPLLPSGYGLCREHARFPRRPLLPGTAYPSGPGNAQVPDL